MQPQDTDQTMRRFAAIPGIGPMKARNLIRFLRVSSVDELRAAAEAGKVERVPGFGKKTQARLLTRLSPTLH